VPFGPGGSVRELELVASELRLTGDCLRRESVDLRILSLLEKKIYRKIMMQSRRKRLPRKGVAA
jgi:hypothetical protein